MAKWAFIKYYPKTQEMVTARWDSSNWTDWDVQYLSDEERIKQLIRDRANNYYPFKKLCAGLTINMKELRPAAFLAALYIQRFFEDIEDIHGFSIFQVYEIFGIKNSADAVADCGECNNKGYVSMLDFHYPCSKCYPLHKNKALTSNELNVFLNDQQ